MGLEDDCSFWDDYEKGFTRIAIRHSALLLKVSEHEIVTMFQEEVARQMREDEDLRILVREAVKSAIAGLSIGEIVALAVSEELKQKRPNSG
jgi:hypothetical protein